MEIDRNVVPAAWASWINVILGIWLIISPWIVGYAMHGTPMWNNIVLGVLVLILGLVASSSRFAAPSWWNVVFGIWLIISPFLLRYARLEGAMVNDLVLGVVVGVLALIAGLEKSSPSRRRAVG
jgi:hypothetical protein